MIRDLIRPLLYVVAWLVTGADEWEKIRGAVAQRVDPRPARPPHTFVPASHEEWKAYVAAERL